MSVAMLVMCDNDVSSKTEPRLLSHFSLWICLNLWSSLSSQFCHETPDLFERIELMWWWDCFHNGIPYGFSLCTSCPYTPIPTN